MRIPTADVALKKAGEDDQPTFHGPSNGDGTAQLAMSVIPGSRHRTLTRRLRAARTVCRARLQVRRDIRVRGAHSEIAIGHHDALTATFGADVAGFRLWVVPWMAWLDALAQFGEAA